MILNPVTKFAAVTLAAIFLVVASACMEGPSDTQAAQDVADEAAYAAAVADGGQAQCRALGRVPALMPDGEPVCRTSRVVLVASGSQP